MVFSKELRDLAVGNPTKGGKGGTPTHYSYFTSDVRAAMGLDKNCIDTLVDHGAIKCVCGFSECVVGEGIGREREEWRGRERHYLKHKAEK